MLHCHLLLFLHPSGLSRHRMCQHMLGYAGRHLLFSAASRATDTCKAKGVTKAQSHSFRLGKFIYIRYGSGPTHLSAAPYRRQGNVFPAPREPQVPRAAKALLRAVL